MNRVGAGLVGLLVSAALVSVGSPGGVPTASVVDSAMVGWWCGTARINDTWVTQRTLDVRVEIRSNGTAGGWVGDATLLEGVFHGNRNGLERTLNMKTDWIIEGTLDGNIVAAEGIHRESVKVPLTWTKDSAPSFKGSVATSGLPIGGERSGGLVASRLRLARCALPIHKPGSPQDRPIGELPR